MGTAKCRILKAFAGFSDPGPTIFHAGQPSFVKRDGAIGQLASPQNSRMVNRDP